MKNSDYWAQRFRLMNDALQDKSYSYTKNLEKQYNSAIADIDKQMRAWYQRFANNNAVSYADAQKLLTSGQLKEFKWTVEEYIKKSQESAINGAWVKELENASARVHISRLEALKLQLRQHAEMLTSERVNLTHDAAQQAYVNGYYRTAYEVQRGLGYGWSMQALNTGALEKVLSLPWTVDDRTFTARCWMDKNKLVQTVNNELTRMLATGAPPDKAIEAIVKQFGVSKANAGRLIMTESAHFAVLAQHDSFKDLDVEQYKIVETFDKNTCALCGAMDGKHFPMSEFAAGANAPPFHPWCRGCIAPYFADMEGVGQRYSRNPDTGKREMLPPDMTYKEWKQAFVDDGDKSDLTNSDNGGKINANDVEPIEGAKVVEPDNRTYRYSTSKDYSRMVKEHTKNVSKSDRAQMANHKKPDGSPGGYVATRNYSNINSNLRGDGSSVLPLDNDDLKTIESLRTAIKANVLDENYILTRYVNVDYLSSVFGVTNRCGEALYYNGILDMPRNMEHVLNQMKSKIGTMFEEKSFVSTSILKDKNVMGDKGVRLTINAPSGTHCFIPKNRKESECILGENTVFYITDVKESPLDRKLEIFVTIMEGK